MEEREEKLNKAREKLDKFRKKKNKSSLQVAPTSVVEDVQINNSDNQSIASSASSPVMFVPSSSTEGHQDDNKVPSQDPLNTVQPAPAAPQPLSSSASSPFELMGDNQQPSSNNDGLAAYFGSSSSNDAASSLDGFTQITLEGIIFIDDSHFMK